MANKYDDDDDVVRSRTSVTQESSHFTMMTTLLTRRNIASTRIGQAHSMLASSAVNTSLINFTFLYPFIHLLYKIQMTKRSCK